MSQKASEAAAKYAAKKKEQMERAGALRAQRAGPVVHESSRLHDDNPQPRGEISTVGGMEVECQSFGRNTERIAVRRPAQGKKPVRDMVAASPSDSRFDNDDEISSSNQHGFFRPPADPAGTQIDLSDRPILCASFHEARAEAVFGGADHALYAVSVNSGDSKRGPKVVKMYSKKCGHTDWVTSVAHIKDGRVISASMDGKLCLWDAADRSHCVDLVGGHTKSVSKVVSSPHSNIALSGGYDANVVLWTFSESISPSAGTSRIRVSAGAKAPATSSSKSVVMSGHKEAVVDCALSGQESAISGDRKGGLVMWDLVTGSALRIIPTGHRGSITQLVALGGNNRHGESGSECGSHMFLSAGVDGMVRLWDARDGGNKPALEIPAHAGIVVPSAIAGAVVPAGGKVAGAGRVAISAAAISCMNALSPTGGGDISGIVTGGADNVVCLLDARMSYGVVERWEHHRVGIYALLTVDNSCIFSGDGAGMMHCYSSKLASADPTISGGLKYGLGCSGEGAVRAIGRIGKKIVTGGEDGKALILSY